MSGDSKKVLYLGDDSAYFKVLSAEFKRLYPNIKIQQLSENTPEGIQSLMLVINHESPALIFIDFSKHTDHFVHLSRILARTNFQHPIAIHGLHDYLAPRENLVESYLAGVPVNHIKSGEVFDVVFDAINSISAGQAKEHGFATGKLSHEAMVYHLCKVGYLSEKGLHFETNIAFEKNEEIRLHHKWIGKKLVPSTLCRVNDTSKELLFYNSKFAVNCEFAWVDPIIEVEGDDPKHVEELRSEREHYVNKSKKIIKSWIEDNTDRSQNKSVRVLVIDRTMTFYNNQPRSDSYGYAIRCQSFLNDPAIELQSQQPHVVAINLDDPQVVDIPEPRNDRALVDKLVQIIKTRFKNLEPYIIVFNIKDAKSKDLQESHKYKNMMAYDGELETSVLIKMAQLFSEKIKKMAEDDAPQQPAYYIKKSNPQSTAEIEETITITQISECDLVLECNRPLSAGQTLRIEDPFKGFVTILDHPQLGKPPSYYAVVNGIGEIEKKNLRRFVNTIFFKDHDAAKAQELEGFASLNKAKWQEMLDKQKAELEASEKAEAQAVAKKERDAKQAPVEEIDKKAEET